MNYYSSPDDWEVDQTEKLRRIVHANDGSENSFRALEAAFMLAERYQGTLRIIIVEEIHPRAGSRLEIAAEKALEDRRVELLKMRLDSIATRFAVPHKLYTFVGYPVRQILQFAREAKADLLVIGATARRTPLEVILGRRSDRIARKASCPVLIVR